MKMLPVFALLVSGATQAATISADAQFIVTAPGGVAGAGTFVLDHSRLTDFEFTIAGMTFTEDDMEPVCTCAAHEGAIDWIVLRGDFGGLFWRFDDSNFGFLFNHGTLHIAGTSQSGEVTGALRGQWALHESVPEEWSLVLFALGIFAAAVVYIAKHPRNR